METINPYEASHIAEASIQSQTRWRIVPTMLSSIVGIASFALGLYVTSSIIVDASHRKFDNTDIQGMLASAIFVMLGVTWIVAGWLYWRRKHWVAALVNVSAIAFVVLAFGLLR